MKSKRNAWNRGSAVYRGGSKVQFLWPCGCKRVETVSIGRGRRKLAVPPDAVLLLVSHWRNSGVTLPECRRHPDWFSPVSQVARLNFENQGPANT